MSQRTISAFFPQSPKKAASKSRPRPESPIDLTGESDDLEQHKRRRTESGYTSVGSSSSNRILDVPPSQSTSASFSQYRLDSTTLPTQLDKIQRDVVRMKRRERLKKVLLAEDKILQNRPSREQEDEPSEDGEDEDGEDEDLSES